MRKIVFAIFALLSEPLQLARNIKLMKNLEIESLKKNETGPLRQP